MTGSDRRTRLASVRIAHHIEDVETLARDTFGGLQGAATGEHRQPREQHAGVVVEQVIAPPDRRCQRPLALGRVARTSGEHGQALGEAIGQRVGTEQRHPARRQLQRERQAVERGHDAGDGGRRPLVQLEPGMHRSGSLGEETDGVERSRVDGIVRRDRHGLHREALLARDLERHATRHEDRETGRTVEQLPHDRCGLDHLLHVVQHQQQPTITEMRLQRLGRVLSRLATNLERRGDLGQHHRGVGHGAQVDEERALRESIQHLRGHVDRQPGLAGATRADQRHQASLPEHLLEPRDLIGAADERGPFGGQVGGASVEGPKLREVGGQPGDHEIVEPQRIGEVLETVEPQVTQNHPIGQGLFDETGGGRRDHHLAAVAHRGDAGRPIDVDPEVVVTPERAFAGVHADPDSDLRSVGPRIRREPFLGLRRRERRAGRRAEDGEERVAFGADLDPAPLVDRRAHDGTVLVLQPPVGFVTERVQQPGRTLDIGEEERHGPGRQVHGQATLVQEPVDPGGRRCQGLWVLPCALHSARSRSRRLTPVREAMSRHRLMYSGHTFVHDARRRSCR